MTKSPQLDTSKLKETNISDMFYLENLSFDNLADDDFKRINTFFSRNRKATINHISKNLPNLSIFGNGAEDNGQHIIFDITSSKLNLFKIKDNNATLSFSTHLLIMNADRDPKKNNYLAKNIDLHLSQFTQLKCELSTYSKGSLVAQRESNYDVITDKYTFDFRHISFGESATLNNEINIILIASPNVQHSDLGDRMVLNITGEFKDASLEINDILVNSRKLKC